MRKFLLKFLDDKSYADLERTLSEGDYKEAFRAAHTLKGVAANLAFTELMERVSELTEQLRPCTEPADEVLYQKVVESYDLTIQAIEAYKAEM